MGVSTVVILIDEHWDSYIDKYTYKDCFEAIKIEIPHAKLVGKWFSTIAVDIGKSYDGLIENNKDIRYDTMFTIKDVEQYNIIKRI